ncbi:hypothetical protein GAYE_SCF66G6820 [Galdieria yellowstonensis]|uniref:Reverse transcriptase domain-containing protein n=1 Tax=Galdieria yellowstonensis TaxID=3028027 RepID=A0AAV9INJ7_9RHOD|nr:hypothetical protein GAYE_SCF66G6820 [Galdieria yellowstonensis]
MRRNSLLWWSLFDDDATRKTPTYLCFVDFRKAFDRVPHEALFRKVEVLGILGRCLAFHHGLYRISWTQAFSRISQTLSPDFSFCRGVVKNRSPGLMFANDVLLLALSRHCLKASIYNLREYLTQFEMKIDCNSIFSNSGIPMDLRLLVVNSCLVPGLVRALSSGGMHQLHTKCLSLLLNQTLRMVVGVHTKHTGVCFTALYTELGIPSVESLIAGRRARVWAKGPSTWVKNIKAWLRRKLEV